MPILKFKENDFHFLRIERGNGSVGLSPITCI